MAAGHGDCDDNRPRLGEHGHHIRSRSSLPSKKIVDLIISTSFYSLWNYNLNNDIRGSTWNGENLSWFSNSRMHESALSLVQDSDELDKSAHIVDAIA